MTVPAVIYHLARRADWAAGQAVGEYRAPSLAAEGFIHASGDEAQLLRVAARRFAGRADLLALEVATARLDGGAPVVPEPASSGEIYPHIYGPINLDAVIRVRALFPDEAAPGGFILAAPDTESGPDIHGDAGAA